MRGKLSIAAALAFWCMTSHAQFAPSVSASPISTSQVSVSYSNISEGYATRIFRNGTPVFTSLNAPWTFTDQSLSPNTTYSYCGVTGTLDEVGNFVPYTGCGNTATATTFGPPAAPSALNASGSGTQINLAWADGSGNETGFLIERKTGSGGTFSQIASVGANVTSYSNTGLTADTAYFYRVRSTNAYGSSGYTNTSSATTAPSAPTGLSATAASGTQVNLTWTDTSSTETGFKLERKTGSGGTYVQIAALGAGITTYSDTSLTSGATYFYRVRDANSSGDSGYSNEANATLAATLTLAFIEVDHLNTPRAVYDANQQLRWKWDQAEPFGANSPNEDPSSLGAYEFPVRYPGQYADKETNLAYNDFRDYDPNLGRFPESDPIGLNGGLNTYIYVIASPLSLTDPTGRDWGICCGDGRKQKTTDEEDKTGATQDFWANYREMRSQNVKQSDKYFHCKANCLAAQRGPAGYRQSIFISNAREFVDQLFGGSAADSAADERANAHGREGGKATPCADCRTICSPFRPRRGLPSNL